MILKTKLMLITFSIGFCCYAKAQNLNDKQDSSIDTESKSVSEQETIIVSEDANTIPAPLQAEYNTVKNWSGSAAFATAEEWQNQRSTNIKDVLDYLPGVFAQQRNGAESARISIRGSGLGRQFQGGGLLLLQDGVPINTADGSFDFQAIDPGLIDYVTVYRGANGMALGGSTLGGVINLGTTHPDSTQANQLRLAAGSFNTQRAIAEYNARFDNNDHALRLRASHFNQQGFRVQNQQNSNRFDLQYLNNSSNGLKHRLGLYHLNTYAELPSSLSRALIEADPRQSRGFNINGNFNHNATLTRLTYQLAGAEHNDSQWSVTFYAASKRLINPVFTFIDRDSDDAGLYFNWQHGNHSMVITTQLGSQDELRFENEAGFAGDFRLSRDQMAHTSTVSYQFEQNLLDNNAKQLSLVMGLQGIYAQRDIDEIRPQNINYNRSFSQLNPKIGLFYQASEQIQWFSNLSRSFEAPTFAELNNGNQPGINIPDNSPIKAQSADTFEIGTRGFIARFNWDVSLYYSQIDDEFIRFRFPNGDTLTTNADQSIHWGLESSLVWQLADSWLTTNDQLKLSSSYQYNQFKLDDDPVFANNRIPGIPDHYLQSRIQYEHPSGWTISPNLEWVPTAYYVDLANSYRTENYLLTGLSLNYKSNRGFELYVDAKNLNDQTYISTTLPIPDAEGTDGNYFYSGEGRAIYAGIKWLFN